MYNANSNKMLWGSDKNAVIALLAINFIVFVFFRMLYIIFQNDPQTHLQDYASVTNQFVLNGNASIFITKPWTLLTYFFTNTTFFSLLSNLIWLFSFAYLLQMLVGNQYLIPSYIYGGVVAGVIFVITCSLFKVPYNIMTGSAPAIMSVAATVVGYTPQYKVFPYINGGVPIWILYVIFLIIDVLICATANPYLIPAHLAAAGIGFIYAKNIAAGKDFGHWMHIVYNAFLGKSTASKKTTTKKQYYQQKVVPFNSEQLINQQNVDRVLDKINAQGYNALTKEEKLILQKAKDKL